LMWARCVKRRSRGAEIAICARLCPMPCHSSNRHGRSTSPRPARARARQSRCSALASGRLAPDCASANWSFARSQQSRWTTVVTRTSPTPACSVDPFVLLIGASLVCRVARLWSPTG